MLPKSGKRDFLGEVGELERKLEVVRERRYRIMKMPMSYYCNPRNDITPSERQEEVYRLAAREDRLVERTYHIRKHFLYE